MSNTLSTFAPYLRREVAPHRVDSSQESDVARSRGLCGNPLRSPSVVIIHSSDELYGADRIVLQTALALRDEVGASVEVWLPTEREHSRFPLCDMLRDRDIPWQHQRLPIMRRANISPVGIWRLFSAARVLQRLLRVTRPDVVICSTSAALIAAPIARLSGTRSVLVHIQELWSGPESILLGLLARFTTGQFAISSAVESAARARFVQPTLIRNCVDRPRLSKPLPHRTSARPRYVVASRWNTWKGHATLAEAWDLAGCPGTLTILGGPPLVGAGVDIEALFARVSQPSTVHIVGGVDDVAPFIAGADALILPSDSPEPFGLLIIEAFAIGRPAIASTGGGPDEIITEGQDGWQFERGSARALAALLSSLSLDALTTAGANAAQTYERRFSSERYRASYAALFMALTGVTPRSVDSGSAAVRQV